MLSRKWLTVVGLGVVTLVTMAWGGNRVAAQSGLSGDANGDGKVDGVDYVVWLNHYNLTTTLGSRDGDFNTDGKIDGVDYVVWLNNYGQVAAPTSVPGPTSNDWSQFGSNAQHTSFMSQGVTTPWRLKWAWNGAGADGKKQAGHLSVPDLVQPITGGNRVYIVANNTVFALDKNSSNKVSGTVIWSRSGIGTLNGTPAYENEVLYVPSTSGIYKLNAASGITVASSSLVTSTLAVTLAGNNLYVVTPAGSLAALDKGSLAKVWEYLGGSAGTTPASYFAGSGNVSSMLVFLTQDLNVHAVNSLNGSMVWKRKPTGRTYQSGTPGSSGAQAEEGWPVIAAQHGIVFVRYRLDWDTLWSANPFPSTNAAIRTHLTENPARQALFALNLANGTTAFVPAVGNGGAGDGGILPMGTQPVVKVAADGREVAYIIWRNGLTCGGCAAAGSCGGQWCDGREDATMGEMVLDNSSVSGYQAGDVRFVKFIDIQTDEMMNIAMAGETIFHSHWLINAAHTITSRAANLGNSFTNPIQTNLAPQVIWRQCYATNVCNYPGCTSNANCPSTCSFNANTRYCSGSGSDMLYSYGDSRSYNGGFYEYHNDNNGGSTPFTVIGNGLVLVKTNDGGIMALESGNPLADNVEVQKTAMTSQDKTAVLGTEDQEAVGITAGEAKGRVGQKVQVTGKISATVDHQPKGVYLWFGEPEKSLLVRIFNADLTKFSTDPLSWTGKQVTVTGTVTLYWPEGKLPEIIVSDPGQIVVE